MSAHAQRRRRPARSPRSYRVAPRRAARSGARSRIDWDRFGRIALVIVLFVVLILYLNPLSNFLDAWGERRGEEQRLAEVRAEHEELSRRAGSLQDPNAAEQEARELGMVAPGERSYVIRGLEP